MLVQTPAIVFRAVDFKESSRIITFFTRDYGKTAVLIKGLRRAKNRWAGLLSHGAVVDLVFYHKENRSVQTFKEADMRVSTVKVQADFDKLAVSMALIELSDQVLHENEPQPEYFDFLETFLNWMNKNEVQPGILFPYLQYRVAELCGVGLQREKISGSAGFLNIISGNISGDPDDGLSFKLSPWQLDYMLAAMDGKSSRLLKKERVILELKNLIYHLDVYLKHHIEGVRDRKSDAIFDQILSVT